MRLLTFNCSAIPLLTPSVEDRLRLLAEEIRGLDPDIVCLQELGLASYARLLESLLRAWPHRFWRERFPAMVAGGLAVFSKRPVARARFEEYREQGPWLGRSYISRLIGKGFMVLEWDDRPLRLLHTHPLPDFARGRSSIVDYVALQGAQFEQLLAHPPRDARPTVAAGDFNVAPGSPLYAKLLNALDARDLMADAAEPSMVPTSDFPEPWGIGRHLDRLDYVLVGSGTAGRARYVLHAPRDVGGRRLCLSDHKGVLAEIHHGP